MSTWICNPRLLLLAAGLALSGCAGEFEATFAGLGAPSDRMSVAGGQVVVEGPEGYCVDRAASRGGRDRSFVLMGSCASISGDPDAPSPPVAAILTASVAAAPAGAVSDLPGFFRTDQGRAALARDGRASSVTILSSQIIADALYLRLRDTSNGALAGTDRIYWRGLFQLNGQLVTLAAIGFSENPLGQDAGLTTLRQFHDAVVAASPRSGGNATPAAQPADGGQNSTGRGLGRALSRLLR